MQTGPRESALWGGIILLLLLVVSTSSYYAFMSMVHNNEKKAKSVSSDQSRAGAASKPHDMTILLMGVDNVDGSSRSDTLILAKFDATRNRVEIMSIPRDTRVYIPGHGESKINHAHAFGDVELTLEAVSDIMNMPIDYYAEIDYEGFERIIDALDGININVEKEMKYTDRAGDLEIDLKPGYQHLDGHRALGYVRFRHDKMGDIGRVGRQEEFVKALMSTAAKPRTFLHLPRLIKELKSAVNTNLSLADMLLLANRLRKIKSDQIGVHMLPGEPQYIGGVSYWIPDENALIKELAKFNGEEEIIKVKVDVLNGSGIDGMAKQLADALAKKGFDIGKVENADNMNYEHTQIIDKTGRSKAITKIYDCIDSAEYSMELTDESPVDIVIIVGKDIKLR